MQAGVGAEYHRKPRYRNVESVVQILSGDRNSQTQNVYHKRSQ